MFLLCSFMVFQGIRLLGLFFAGSSVKLVVRTSCSQVPVSDLANDSLDKMECRSGISVHREGLM